MRADLPARAPLGAVWAAGVLGVAALLAAVWAAPWAAPGLAAAAVGVTGLTAFALSDTARQPGVPFLVLCLLSLAVQGNSDDGYSPLQLVFGLYLALYVGGWYAATLIGGRRFLRSPLDLAPLYLIAVGGPIAIVLGPANGILLPDYLSDLACLLAFALFFPAREVCVRLPRGPMYVAGVLLGIGVYAAVANYTRLYLVLSSATELFQIVDVRLTTGEIHITFAIIVLALLLTLRASARLRLTGAFVAVLLLGGLILTKSRGAWLTTVVGLGAAGLVAGFRVQRRLVVGAVLGVVGVGVLSTLVFGDTLVLIGAGLLRRFASISTALSQDVSLLNRYAENDAVWRLIWASPFFGYGWGVPIQRFDIILHTTTTWGFMHQGYLWLWHKVGLFGLAAHALVLAGAFRQAAVAARARAVPALHRALAAAAAGCLAAVSLIAIPSNPYAVLDHILVLALALALASGLYHRSRGATPGLGGGPVSPQP